MTDAPPCEAWVRADELVALIAQYAVTEGPTRSGWPGLTFYRFGQRVAPHWEAVGSPSLYLVAQGRQLVNALRSEQILLSNMSSCPQS